MTKLAALAAAAVFAYSRAASADDSAPIATEESEFAQPPPSAPRARESLPLATEARRDWAVLYLGINPKLGSFGGLATLSLVTSDVDAFYGGTQISLMKNEAARFVGIGQIAVMHNRATDIVALTQVSVYNRADGFKGLAQLGLGNYARHIDGMQVGVVNVASKVRGIQIGLVNSAETIAGVQIGLANHIEENGALPWTMLVNVGFGEGR